MKLIRKPKNIIRIWILTYICILLIPTIANIIIGYYFINGMNEEIENYNQEYLSKIADEVDNILMENVVITDNLSKNKKLKELAMYKTIGNNENREIYNFVAETVNSYYDSIGREMYIYLKNSSAMLAKGALAEKNIAYEIFPFDEAIGYEEWQRLVNNSYAHKYVQLSDNLYEVHTLFFGTDYEVNVFIRFGKSYFHWKNGELFPDDANVMICDREGNAVYSKEEIISFEKMNFIDDMGVLDVKTNNGNDMICYLKSDVTNWIYLMSVPRTEFYRNTNKMRVLEFVIVLVFLAIAIVMIIIVSMHNFKPLQKIISALGGDANESGYDFIENSINRISGKYDDMSRRNLVSQVLLNSISVIGSEEFLKDYGINVPDKAAAVVLRVNDGGTMIDSRSGRREIDAFYFALENVFEEIASEHGFGTYFTSCDGIMSVLVDVSGDISLSDLIMEIENVYETVLSIKCTICVGEIEAGIASVSNSFSQAKQVLNLMRFMNETGTGCYDKTAGKNLRMSEKTLNVLKVSVNNFDFDAFSEEVVNMFRFSLNKPGISDVRLVMYDISRLLLETLKENNASVLPEDIKNVAEAENFEEFLERIKAVFVSVEDTKDEEADEIDNIAKIKSFVDGNYTNSELSNQMIAEYVGFSVNYVSKYFKKQTDEGLLDYITRVRVESAKKLLADTDKTLGEIAALVGFYNALALIRAYKKLEGITPTQYRAIKDK